MAGTAPSGPVSVGFGVSQSGWGENNTQLGVGELWAFVFVLASCGDLDLEVFNHRTHRQNLPKSSLQWTTSQVIMCDKTQAKQELFL